MGQVWNINHPDYAMFVFTLFNKCNNVHNCFDHNDTMT